jgi:hypothetical protein
MRVSSLSNSGIAQKSHGIANNPQKWCDSSQPAHIKNNVIDLSKADLAFIRDRSGSTLSGSIKWWDRRQRVMSPDRTIRWMAICSFSQSRQILGWQLHACLTPIEDHTRSNMEQLHITCMAMDAFCNNSKRRSSIKLSGPVKHGIDQSDSHCSIGVTISLSLISKTDSPDKCVEKVVAIPRSHSCWEHLEAQTMNSSITVFSVVVESLNRSPNNTSLHGDSRAGMETKLYQVCCCLSISHFHKKCATEILDTSLSVCSQRDFLVISNQLS